jgi:hypothetical protein
MDGSGVKLGGPGGIDVLGSYELNAGSLCSTTVPTKTFDFHHLPYGRESMAGGLAADQPTYFVVVDLGDRTTLTTDQELADVRAAGITAADKGVQ